MLIGYSEKLIKGVAALEVPEVSLLYACIDLNSHLRACPLHTMCAGFYAKQNAAYCRLVDLLQVVWPI